MAFPFNNTDFIRPQGPDLKDPGNAGHHIPLEPRSELTYEKIQELMRGSEVYDKPV